MAIRLLSENLSSEVCDRLVKDYGLSDLKGEPIAYFEEQIKRVPREEKENQKPAKKAKVQKSVVSAIHTSRMRKVTDFFKKK